ncbi:MAG: phospho-sugar mutase, partial [Ferruginibacter sp.]
VDDVKWEGNNELIEIIGEKMDDAYMDMVKGLSVYPEVCAKQHDLKIVYTPIHGTGIKLVPEVLKRFGFTNVSLVKEQITPDGDFPTVIYPNPEEQETMSLGLKQARAENADILLGTDPDADRVGVGVKNDKGEWILLNGNQTALLAFNYLIEARKAKGIAEPNDMVIKTIVTTDMIDVIAKKNGVACYNVLTGFKWISSLIKQKEANENYIIGGEESFGLMIGDKIRDKDGVSAVAIMSEMAAYEMNKGRSLYDKLVSLYIEYGFYKESLISVTKKGMNGAKEISDMMEAFRKNPPKEIIGLKVSQLLDYKKQEGRDLINDTMWKIDIPQSNVLQFLLEDGSKISARPSGTEPKIKFYFSVNTKLENASDIHKVEKELDDKILRIQNEMGLK